MPDDLFLISAAALAAAVALLVWKKRPAPGSFPLLLLMWALVGWAIGALLAQSRDSASAGRFWYIVSVLGRVLTPAAWLAFAFQYTGRGWRLTRRTLLFLAIEPALFLLLVSTDLFPYFLLGSMGVSGADLFLVPSTTVGGIGFLLHQLYSYSLTLVGAVMLVQSLGRSWDLNRGVAVTMLVGAIAPCIGAVVGYWNLDLAPMAFVFTGVIFAWGILQYGLLDIIPSSREILLDGMSAGMMVLDKDDRVVDLNPAAERILGCSLVDAIARPVDQAVPDHADLIRQYQGVQEAQDVILLGDRDAQCPYDLRISPLSDRHGRSAGRIFSFHDVTKRMQAGQSLREREQYLSLLHDITSAALEGPDLQSMLQTLADRLGELIHADNCYLTLWDEEHQKPIPAAAYGEGRETYRALEIEPGEMTMTESVLRAGHPVVVDNVFESPHLSRRIAALFPDRSMLGLPLIARGQKLGAILVSFNEPHHFTPDEIQRIEQAAGQIALAIDKARLLEVEREHRRMAENLRQAVETVAGTLSMDETLPRIFEQLERVVPYDSATLFLLEGKSLRAAAARGFPPQKEIIGQSYAMNEDPLFLEMQQSRRPLILPDAREDSGY